MLRSFTVLCALLCTDLVFDEKAWAQGDRQSSAIDLATNPQDLAPGQWVLAPDISPEGPVTVLVDLTMQVAYVYRNGVQIGLTNVSTGRAGHETPTGVFTILQMDADHRSSTYNNAPMPFQQRLTWDGVALHAGGLPGYPESHGCVHLPYEFARELFGITHMGGTVVVTGRAGAPVEAAAGGVLAPFEEGGAAVRHHPLPQDVEWFWSADDPGVGPISIVISTSDNRAVVLRNGEEIGRAHAEIDPDHAGTHVATLQQGTDGRNHWLLLGVPGHENEANHAINADVLDSLRLPDEFHRRLHAVVEPGTTVLVTSASVGARNSGRRLTVLSALETHDGL